MMKLKSGVFQFVAVIALSMSLSLAMYSSSAFADDEPTSISSPTSGANPAQPASKPSSAPSLYDKISDKVWLSYFNIVRGAPLSDVTNRYQPAPDGTIDTTNTQSMESTVTTGWKLDKDTVLGFTTHFFYSPLGNPTSEGNANMQWLDPALMISRANMVNNNGFKIKGQLFATLPMSRYDTLKKNGTISGVSPTAIMTYDVPKSKLSVGLYSYLTAYIPGSDTTENYRTLKLVMAPNANYQITKSFAATMWIDAIQVTRKRHTGIFSGMNNPEMDIEPGVNWDVTPFLSLNPFLNIYPGKMTMSATSLQMVLAGKIF